MGTWCLRHTLIVLFSFRFLPSHIHLNAAVTDLICIADTVMKTDLNLLNSFKKEFVRLLSEDPHGPYGGCSCSIGFFLLFFLNASSNLFHAFLCTSKINAAPLPLASRQNQTLRTFLKMEMDCFFYCESDGNRSKR